MILFSIIVIYFIDYDAVHYSLIFQLHNKTVEKVIKIEVLLHVLVYIIFSKNLLTAVFIKGMNDISLILAQKEEYASLGLATYILLQQIVIITPENNI